MDVKSLNKIQELSNSVDEKYQLITFKALLKNELNSSFYITKNPNLEKIKLTIIT